MKYGFFPGCNMPAIRPDVEHAIRLTMPKLGVDLLDLEGYVCCPAFGTFPSLDEDAQLAVNAWNLSLGESHQLDLMVECGSCYSSLRTGCHLLSHNAERRERVNALLAKADKSYEGRAQVKHITEVLWHDVGPDQIAKSVTRPMTGLKAVIQYPCHTLYPSDVVGFEESSAHPHILADLVRALGGEVEPYSREHQCCGGAGGFHKSSKHEAFAFAQMKLDSIVEETQADVIVVSCITCLMHLDKVQHELSNGERQYAIPVLDYSQLLALAMGFAPEQVASIATTSREPLLAHFR